MSAYRRAPVAAPAPRRPHARWSDAFAEALRGRPAPLVRAAGASLARDDAWRGARAWRAWIGEQGLAAGDRIVCALPPGAAFAMVLVAALDVGLTLVPAPPEVEVDAAVRDADARLAVAATARAEHTAAPTPLGAPPGHAVATRRMLGAPTPDARVILHTSGSTGARRGIALSDANLWAVLDSHRAPLALAGATLLSVLPWHHVFGLVLELLPALLDGATLVREASAGRDAASVVHAARAHGATHLHAVPLTVRRVADAPGGHALLARLRGGLVGGAPVDAPLAGLLAGTRLRVGYGQTEASPGITLGDPGEWRASLLGRPLGCDVRIEDDGELAFRGANACAGAWRDGALHLLPPDGWRRTGDLAHVEADGTLTFVGRTADRFKLANGRFVDAAPLEAAVRARFAGIDAALLSPTPDGHGLRLAVSCHGDPPPAHAVAPVLGRLAALPLVIIRVDGSAWVRTAKGELDRRWPVGRER